MRAVSTEGHIMQWLPRSGDSLETLIVNEGRQYYTIDCSMDATRFACSG